MRYQVLGPIGAYRVGGDLVRIPAGRQRTLLAALLAHRGQVVSRDALIDALWRADLPADPLNALQHYVARLRSVAGAAVRGSGAGYLLDVDDHSVDADESEAMMRDGRVALTRGEPERALDLLGRALGLWNGEPFAEFMDLELVKLERVRLAEQREVAIDDRFEAMLAAGKHDTAVAELVVAVTHQPDRERRWGQLMRAQYRLGRPAQALATYQRARSYLIDELGVDPSHELQNLELRILNHDSALRAPERRQTAIRPPRHRTSFVGRETAMRSLKNLLERGRLVTVRGPSGVGKTRLAMEWAALAEPPAPWVSVEAVTRATLLVPTICAAVGAPEDPGKDALEHLVEHLRDRSVTLVLDGCDRLASTVSAVVDRVLADCPGIRVVVTSQPLLGIADEAQLMLSGLSTMAMPGNYSDASQLFLDRAGLRRPDFAPTSSDMTAIEELVHSVDGLPLGIELTAARIGSATPEEILRALTSGRDLPAADGTRPRRHTSLTAALSWTLSLLGDPERRTFEELAQLCGTFTPDTAAQICTANVGEVSGHIGELVERALIHAGRRGTRTVYSISAGMRHHVNPEGKINDRVLSHYVELASQIDEGLRGPQQLEWLSRGDIERENLALAFGSALRSDAAAASLIAAGLGSYLDWRGLIAEANQIFETALRIKDGAPQLSIRMWAGFFAWEAGDKRHAQTLMDGAVDLAASGETPESSAMALSARGLILRTAARPVEAHRDLIAGLKLAVACGDRWSEAWTCSVLAACELDLDDNASAAAYARRALDGFRRLGDRRGEGWALAARAAVLEQRGDLEDARAASRDAVLLAHSITDARTVAVATEILARIARREGNVQRAVQLLACIDAMQLRRGAHGLPSKATPDVGLDELEDALGHQLFTAAWERGAAADLVDLALNEARQHVTAKSQSLM
jgi:predicted ATPase